MIDPNFWRDEKVAQCSYMERLLFQGLWTFAEDSGVGRASPLLIKADVFPYDTLREADIQKSLAKMENLGMILLYEREGQQYYFVTNFKKHQTINKPSQCYLPTPLPEDYRSTPVVVTSEDKEKISKEEVKLREENGAPARFSPPSLDEVKAYCRERGNSVDPQRFYDFFTEGRWKDSKGNQVKNWKQKIITWETHGNGQANSQGGNVFLEMMREEQGR